jgi:hypothetical protein
MRGDTNAWKFWRENLKKGDQFEDKRTGEGIILK